MRKSLHDFFSMQTELYIFPVQMASTPFIAAAEQGPPCEMPRSSLFFDDLIRFTGPLKDATILVLSIRQLASKDMQLLYASSAPSRPCRHALTWYMILRTP